MIRFIAWIEQHRDDFFKLNGFLWLIRAVVSMAAIIIIVGWPPYSTDGWGEFKRTIFQSGMIYHSIDLLIGILYLSRKYLVFPLSAMYLFQSLSSDLIFFENVSRGIYLFVIPNLLGVFSDVSLFILAILGTIMWVRKFYGISL